MIDSTIKIDKLPEKTEFKIREQLRIGEDLNKELDEAAGWFGYYMAAEVKSETRLRDLELEFEVWRAGRYKEIISISTSVGDKKPTKDQIEAEIVSSSSYIVRMKEIHKAKEAKSLLKGLERAFEKRVDTIRTKVVNKRRESSHD